MDFKQVFAAIAFVLICIVGFFTMVNDGNSIYGTSLGADMEDTRAHTQSLLTDKVNNYSMQLANSTQAVEGPGTASTEQDLVGRSLKSIGLLDEFLGLVPAVIRDGARVVGIPEAYVNAGLAVFFVAFTITLIYLLVLGVRRLV